VDEACTVYFDGACPLCRREIAHYRAREGAESICWVDVTTAESGVLGEGLDREAALARLHVRGADGQLVSGAAAFAAIWRRLPAYAWLGRLASPRPVQWVLEGGYRGFLAVRRLWRPAPAASTGALPALFVPRAVQGTVQAVETFVDRHYADQAGRLAGQPVLAPLRDLLEACRLDEVAHRDEAAMQAPRDPGILMRA
jgi:predicted DCC family thiol-disulfide oxidoreductase YuxK